MKSVLVAGLVVALGARTAHAQEAACDESHLRVVGDLDDAWTSEARRVCKAIPTLPDVDRTAIVTLIGGTPVTLSVLLADGRSTVRALGSPLHLRSTVEALITLLPEDAIPAADAPAATTEVEAAPETEREAREKRRAAARAAREARRKAAAYDTTDVTPAPPVEKTSELGVELGAILMGRVAGTPAYISTGPTGWASLEFSSWVFGLHIRWDALEKKVGGVSGHMRMKTIGAGLDISRRFTLTDVVALDTGASMRVLETYQTAWRKDSAPGEPREYSETSGAETDVRFAVVGQLHVGGDGVRGTFSLEAELSPIRIGGEKVKIDSLLPRLPGWSIGTGAGLSWRGG